MTTNSDERNIKQQFFNSLKRGTGEAYLIAKNHPTIDFSAYLIKSALRNYAYDGQSESSRAQYIFDLLCTSAKKEKIRQAILKGLRTEIRNTWALTQLFDLAKLFAQQGDQEARAAIHSRFFENVIEGSDWVGYHEIIELDGMGGLLFIADKIGRYVEQHPDNWQDDSIIWHFQNNHPGINAMQKLEGAAASNTYIRLYLDNVKETEASAPKYQRPVYNFETLQEQIEKSERTYIGPAYTKKLATKEINKLADCFLKEKSLVKKEKYLSIFTRIKFPYDYKLILELATRKKTNKNRLVEFAVDALRHLKAAEIRAFALEKLKDTKYPEIYTDLLINNYSEGDANLLSLFAEKAKNEHVIENLASSYVRIYEANKTDECLGPLRALYNKMNCGIHRNSIVQIMIDNEVLPESIYKEIEFDSDEETRKLYQKETANRAALADDTIKKFNSQIPAGKDTSFGQLLKFFS